MIIKAFLIVGILGVIIRYIAYSNNYDSDENNSLNESTCPDTFFYGLFENGWAKDKFKINSYIVKTDDDVLLKVFRVNLKEKNNQPFKDKKNIGRVVLLAHGFVNSSDGWFYTRDNKSLGFYLASKGYDVWVHNSRGNKYSHSSANKSITNEKFYDYSFDQFALIDMPTIYKYILDMTNHSKKIIYIGHSQGTQQLFAALSEPEIKDFISKNTEVFVALAPVVFLTNITGMQKKLSQLGKYLYKLTNLLNISEISYNNCAENSWWKKLAGYIFGNQTVKPYFNKVWGIFRDSCEFNSGCDDLERYLNHFPAGTSMKNVSHMSQLINSKQKFQKYDYGEVENMLKYGQKTPIEYDISNIDKSLKIVLFIGKLDNKTNKADTDKLYDILKNRNTEDYTKIYYLDNWDHESFATSRNPQQFYEALDNELNV